MILATASAMDHTNYGELRQLFETFTRVWGAGGQTSLHLHTLDGQARATLDIQLGPPSNPRPGAPGVGGERPGPAHGHHHQFQPPQQRPRRRGPAARARDAARREAWQLQRSRKEASDTLVETPTAGSAERNDTVADKDVMQDHVENQIKCSHCDFESKSHRGIKTHMGHKHKDLENIEIMREHETADKSLELSVIVEDRDDLSPPLANSTINLEEPVTVSKVNCDEEAENITGVSITHKITANEMKSKEEIENDLTFTKLWDNLQISHFMVEEDSGTFSVEVTIEREDFPEDLNVSLAASFLKSLKWPLGYSVISVEPLRYLT